MGAVTALKSPQEHVQECVKIYQRRRDVLVEGLGEIGLPCVSPEGGWYMLADTKDFEKDSYKFADYLLREAGVATTPMRGWGKFCRKRHIRLIFSTEPEDRLKDALTKIGVALKKLKNSK
jgi:Aspartate/tyrosine/aromatic aminotransferase